MSYLLATGLPVWAVKLQPAEQVLENGDCPHLNVDLTQGALARIYGLPSVYTPRAEMVQAVAARLRAVEQVVANCAFAILVCSAVFTVDEIGAINKVGFRHSI
jgi:hypothetical protein